MDNLGTLLIYAAITAFSFFVDAPITLNAISTFGVQKKFAKEMVSLGVIEEKNVKEIESKKQIAGLIVAAICLAAVIFSASRINLGYICFLFGFILGLLRYRNILQLNSLTVKRFQNTYTDLYDKDKLKEYIDRTF